MLVSGRFGADMIQGRLSNLYTYTITDLGNRYDDNDDGGIQRDEVISAIKDYFNDLITREETIEVCSIFPVEPTGQP